MKNKLTTTACVAMTAALGMTLAACSNDGGTAGEQGAAADDEGGAQASECDVSSSYPEGPVEIIVGYPAGGGTDSVGRLLADGLSDRMGVPVNVVNRTGGSGVVGAEAIANADPDGYSLGILGSDVILSHWMGNTDVTIDSFTSIGQVNRDGSALVVAADSEWESAQDMIDAVKASPGTYSASGTGAGGIWHLGMIDMLLSSGLDATDVTWVPSEGAAPALQQVVAGGVDISTASLGEAITQLEGGSVKALAVSGEERSPDFPDVPTFEEATGSQASTSVRRGLGAPAGLDPEITDELSCHVEAIVASDVFIETMGNLGLSIEYLDAEAFHDGLASDDQRLGELLDEAGMLP